MTAIADWSSSLAALEGRGFFILDNVLEDESCQKIIQDFDVRRLRGEFQDAGVGSSAELKQKIRKSELIWLDPGKPPRASKIFLDLISDLKDQLNRNLFMGLKEWEAFYSVYRPGSHYRRHVDNFQGRNNRIVTFILYLNRNWKKENGGQLRVYWDPSRALTSPHLDTDKQCRSSGKSTMDLGLKEELLPCENGASLKWQECFLDVEPVAGRMVVFYAPDLEHEVLPCYSDRYCITGWLRR